MRKRSAESKCSEGNTSSTNVVHTERADGFGVAKQVGADLSVQRVDCGTQTDNAPTSTVAASLPEFTTIEAILGRSRATQTFPHARTVFTRSTQFQAPIRPTDQPSIFAQIETTGSVAGMAIPFNHITLSGDRRGDGGA